MKLRYILIALLSFFSFYVSAQTIEWAKCFGGSDIDLASSVDQTTDGGFIIAGWADSDDGDITASNGQSDYWIIRLDSLGNLLWQKSLGGTLQDVPFSIKQTNDEGFIVAGYSKSNDGDVSGNNGNFDLWVVKLDTIGAVVWQNCLGGSSFESGESIQQTDDGGYIIGGYTLSDDGDVSGNHGSWDYWVVKLDSDGILLWQKTFGGSDDDKARSIQQTNDGGYVVAGQSFSSDGDVTNNHGMGDCWIVKLDTLGNLIWQKSLGGSFEEIAYSITSTADGGFIVAGASDSNDGDVSGNHGQGDVWVVRLDAEGELVWQKCLGGISTETGFEVHQTIDGGVIVAGLTSSQHGDVSGNHGASDTWVVKLDMNGILIWQKCLGATGWDGAFAIQQTQSGGYIVAGYSYSDDGDVVGNHGHSDYWVVKLSDVTTTIENPVPELDIRVYPNPVSEILVIESEKFLTNPYISLLTLDGKLIYRHRYGSAEQFSIDVSSLETGFYLLEILSEDNAFNGSVNKKIFVTQK